MASNAKTISPNTFATITTSVKMTSLSRAIVSGAQRQIAQSQSQSEHIGPLLRMPSYRRRNGPTTYALSMTNPHSPAHNQVAIASTAKAISATPPYGAICAKSMARTGLSIRAFETT